MFTYYFKNFVKKYQFRYFFTRTIPKYKDKSTNFYEILQIDNNSSQEQIREAYLKLAKLFHPDLNKDAGASDKFKTITLAYEALHNEKNREVYDAYVKKDRHSHEWKYKEDQSKDYEKDFYRDKAKYDKFSEDYYKTKSHSNFWGGKRDSFEEEIIKDYDKIFKSEFKKKPKTRGEDILLEITISLLEAHSGVQKGVKFSRREKCHSCNGSRSAHGHRPSKCFHCNGQGDIKTNIFNSKSCVQCKGTGFLIKHPCKQCNAKGSMNYDTNEVFAIPKGIISGTNIRIDNKGNSAENLDLQHGDLVIKVTIQPTENYEIKDNDIHINVNISLYQAIFGDKIKLETLLGNLDVIIPPGTQIGDKIIFKNMGMPKVDKDKFRGDIILIFQVLIPNINDFKKEDGDLLIKLLKK